MEYGYGRERKPRAIKESAVKGGGASGGESGLEGGLAGTRAGQSLQVLKLGGQGTPGLLHTNTDSILFGASVKSKQM